MLCFILLIECFRNIYIKIKIQQEFQHNICIVRKQLLHNAYQKYFWIAPKLFDCILSIFYCAD